MSGIVKRKDKIAYYGINGSNNSVVYHKMKGFCEMSVSKNPKEYSRQYIDEEFAQADVVGYSPSISFMFDQFEGNTVHDDIIAIANNEAVGDSAVRSILIVDFTEAGSSTGSYRALRRDFSIIPTGEGNSMDAYTYSGSMKVKGSKTAGNVSSTDGFETCTFTADIG